jgi:hypothetical protein
MGVERNERSRRNQRVENTDALIFQ